MQMVPKDKPPPRLLNTVVPDVTPAAADERGNSALSRSRLFSGNGLAIFVGLAVGCLGLGGAGWWHDRHVATDRAASMAPVLTTASTGTVTSSKHEASPPAPIIVQISSDQIRVTAISLGHPRLAVINEQQVGEGDFVKVHAPTVRTETKLQVMKIADGQIDLSDGSQTIVARLTIPAKQTARP